MIKRFCDRCKEEINGLGIAVRVDGLDKELPRDYQLCRDCGRHVGDRVTEMPETEEGD